MGKHVASGRCFECGSRGNIKHLRKQGEWLCAYHADTMLEEIKRQHRANSLVQLVPRNPFDADEQTQLIMGISMATDLSFSERLELVFEHLTI